MKYVTCHYNKNYNNNNSWPTHLEKAQLPVDCLRASKLVTLGYI